MTVDDYQKLYPDAAKPTFMGAAANQGRLVIGPQYPDEGYAVLRCGDTEVQINYSLLSRMQLQIAGSASFAALADLPSALHSITCEASLGRTGDERAPLGR
ncbi:MAG TPA: hypothetical protein VF503_20520 [Sphingobium sp.]|uniref:hypothetical protein n=1 Tax=Sphingobium sp. TaxID=1912891 RepID=UPI002ED2098F